jgi:hypothetical protein
MDHERAAADRCAVDPFRRQAEIMRNRHRGLAGGCSAVDVGGLEPVDVNVPGVRLKLHFPGEYN